MEVSFPLTTPIRNSDHLESCLEKDFKAPSNSVDKSSEID